MGEYISPSSSWVLSLHSTGCKSISSYPLALTPILKSQHMLLFLSNWNNACCQAHYQMILYCLSHKSHENIEIIHRFVSFYLVVVIWNFLHCHCGVLLIPWKHTSFIGLSGLFNLALHFNSDIQFVDVLLTYCDSKALCKSSLVPNVLLSVISLANSKTLVLYDHPSSSCLLHTETTSASFQFEGC